MVYDVPQLLAMSQAQLDDLFRSSPAGDVPDGEARGTAILAPGMRYSETIANFLNHFGWQGKAFDAARGVLKSTSFAYHLEPTLAKVYKGSSWLDGRECVVIDYSETSRIAHYIRDEIRVLGPDFRLGKVYWGQERLIDFCLQF